MTRAHISGLNGLNTNFFGGGSGCSIVEADVEIADDMNPNPENQSFWGWTNLGQGQIVLTHEFGHALGLLHFQGFDVMRALTPLPITGGFGSFAQPFGDDAKGVRFLYGGSSTNVFASAQKLLNNTIVATTSGQAGNPTHNCVTVSGPGFCRGQVIGFDVTMGNNGSVSKTANARIYLNNSQSPGTGWNMWTGTATVNASAHFTQLMWVPIPTSAPNGFYWIFWEFDGNNAVAEFNESDNSVFMCMTLNLTC